MTLDEIHESTKEEVVAYTKALSLSERLQQTIQQASKQEEEEL